MHYYMGVEILTGTRFYTLLSENILSLPYAFPPFHPSSASILNGDVVHTSFCPIIQMSFLREKQSNFVLILFALPSAFSTSLIQLKF